MIEWSKIEPKLGTWSNSFEDFHKQGGFEAIFSFLKAEGKNKKIVPESPDLFRAFKECPRSELKCIIVGQDPYPAIKAGKIVADGLAFSCSHTKEEQPSLKLIYDGIESDLSDGLNLSAMRDPSLTWLANQGVLLLNSALTCFEGRPGSHVDLWKPFMEYFFESLEGFSGLIYVFMGKQAQEYSDLVNTKTSYIQMVEHPAAASYGNRPWKHEKIFSYINKTLKENNNTEIDFLNELPF